MHIKPLVLLLAVILLAGSIFAALSKGTGFMPSMDSTQISLSIEMPEDSTFEESTALLDEVYHKINVIEDIETIGMTIGDTGLMSMASSSDDNSISAYVILKEDKTNTSQETAKQIEELCKDLPCEVSADGNTMDISMLSGSGISLQIEGNDLTVLKDTAADIAAELEKIEGTAEITSGITDPSPELSITINKDKAMKNGLTVAQAYMELQKAITSETNATTLTEDSKDYSIVVIDENSEKRDIKDIRDYTFTVTGKEGEEKEVRLSDIADFTNTESLSSISRINQKRYITVGASIADGYNIGLVSADVEKAFESYELPEGYHITFTGENESINDSIGQLMKMLILAVLFIYLIMVAQFQSLLSPFIVMFTIPLAFTGGFIGLFITNNEVSVISLIGFVMLAGIIVNNGIVLVDTINQLRISGMDKRSAIIEAGRTRMRPILMTVITTVLGLSTMALGMGMGADMMQPIAIVTIGGLLYATVMTLFIVPILYDLLYRKEMRIVDDQELVIMED